MSVRGNALEGVAHTHAMNQDSSKLQKIIRALEKEEIVGPVSVPDKRDSSGIYLLSFASTVFLCFPVHIHLFPFHPSNL